MGSSSTTPIMGGRPLSERLACVAVLTSRPPV
jgi:hypothetical protein